MLLVNAKATLLARGVNYDHKGLLQMDLNVRHADKVYKGIRLVCQPTWQGSHNIQHYDTKHNELICNAQHILQY
jgi:hypothetical protein